MTDDKAALQKRIEELEIKHATLGVIVEALLALLPENGEYEQELRKLIERHDADLLYATSLSDEQRHVLLSRLTATLKGLEARSQQP